MSWGSIGEFLAMGGYGPNQYYHLLQTKASGLKLATIICGLYMGRVR